MLLSLFLVGAVASLGVSCSIAGGLEAEFLVEQILAELLHSRLGESCCNSQVSLAAGDVGACSGCCGWLVVSHSEGRACIAVLGRGGQGRVPGCLSGG